MMRVPVLIAALMLAAPASAIPLQPTYFQISGSGFTSCEKLSPNGYRWLPCKITRRADREAHPFDGWFSIDNNNPEIVAGPLHAPSGDTRNIGFASYNEISPQDPYNNSMAPVDVHIPWLTRLWDQYPDTARGISLTFTDGVLVNWFLSTTWIDESSPRKYRRGCCSSVRGAKSTFDNHGISIPNLLNYQTPGNRYWLGTMGTITRIDGPGTLPPPPPVPLPASAALLLGGLASVFALRRRPTAQETSDE